MTTTDQQAPSRRITDEVTSWPGVEAGPGSRGEFAFTFGRRQLGHLHGDRVAHFGFPPKVGAELREQGRVGPHPVAPDKTAWAARSIESDEDVRDVIALLRLNYDRAVERFGLPGLVASTPQTLSFAKDVEVRAFTLQRDAGNLLVYSSGGLEHDDVGPIEHWYLNHWHEAMFPATVDAPLLVHEADRAETETRMHVRATFSRRHVLSGDFEVIPIPGHTPGATAYLWDSGAHRMLFTGDSLYLRDGEWVAAVLDSSDRATYIASLELIRDLDFDVLVPWAASVGQPAYALTDEDDRRGRIDAILERVRSGADH